MRQINQKTRIRYLAAALGVLLFALSLLPSILLGENGYIIVHDQLDGEVPAYILTARHLQDDSIPEFLNGENNKETLTPASWGTLLFYLTAKPASAFMLNETFIRIAAFLGMFLLLRKWKLRTLIAYASAFLFSLLNFYSVYGLAVMGQPLLLYGYLQAKDRKAGVLPYMIAVLFACFSSPVLVGYADITVLAVIMIVLLIRKKPGAAETGLFMLLLILTYGILYRNLFAQVLGGASFVSHRIEWLLPREKTWSEQFTSIFREGIYHAEASQTTLVPWVLAAGAGGALLYDIWDGKQKETVRTLWTMTAGAALAAVIYATWRSEPVISFREQTGGAILSFRFERFFWLNPLLWWAAFGLTLQMLRETAGLSRIGETTRGLLSRAVSAALAVVFTVSTAVTVYDASPLKQNLIRLKDGVQETDMTFEKFYSEDLFGQIDDYIGRPKDSYRVGSIGLYPSIALYNGFYCIDGYSNNYDVEYKHAFREIISKELKKKKSIRTYFDEWGNRCFLFTSELGKEYYYDKNSTTVIKKLNISAKALRSLGCEYILSGVEIQNAKKTGLILLGTFEHESSPYRIWLYQVKGS